MPTTQRTSWLASPTCASVIANVLPVLDEQMRDPLVLTAFVLGALGALLGVVSWLGLRRLVRDTAILQADNDGASLVDVVADKAREIAELRNEVAAVNRRLDHTAEQLRDALRHVAVVRYDAFGDMGGRMSFSAAMLDDHGDGIVLTSIHGRTETRVYLKGVQKGTSEQLSPEENQAIRHAQKDSSTTVG